MKKLVALILCLSVIVCVFASCNFGGDDTTETTTTTEKSDNSGKNPDKDTNNNTTTDPAAKEKLQDLKKIYVGIAKEFYGDVELEKLENIYYDAIFVIVKAPSKSAMDTEIANAKKKFEAVPTINKKLVTLVDLIKANGISSPADDSSVVEAKDLVSKIEAGYASDANTWAKYRDAALIKEFNEEIYLEWANEYVKVGALSLKKQMSEVNALKISIEMADKIEKINKEFVTWKDLANDPVYKVYVEAASQLNGFADAIDAFEKVTYPRIQELKVAKEAAKEINTAIADLKKEVKPSTDFKTQIEEVRTTITTWLTQYHIEKDPKKENYVAANYNLVQHDVLADTAVDFEEAVKDVVKAFSEFTAAVDAITKITAKSGDVIEDALAKYNAAARAKMNKALDPIFVVKNQKTIADYYVKIIGIKGEYVDILNHIATIKELCDKYGSITIQIEFEETYKTVDGKKVVDKTADQVKEEYEANLEAAEAAIATINANVKELTDKKDKGGHAQDSKLYPDADTKAAIAKIELVCRQYKGYLEVNEKYNQYNTEDLTDTQKEYLLGAKSVLVDSILELESADEYELFIDIDGLFAKVIADSAPAPAPAA